MLDLEQHRAVARIGHYIMSEYLKHRAIQISLWAELKDLDATAYIEWRRRWYDVEERYEAYLAEKLAQMTCREKMVDCLEWQIDAGHPDWAAKTQEVIDNYDNRTR